MNSPSPAVWTTLASGIGGILMFGLVEDSSKDAFGTAAYSENGATQEAIRALRREYPDLVISYWANQYRALFIGLTRHLLGYA